MVGSTHSTPECGVGPRSSRFSIRSASSDPSAADPFPQVFLRSGRKRSYVDSAHAGCSARRAVLGDGEATQIQQRRAFERIFEDGEIIFEEGDEGIDLYVIRAGQVQISRAGAAGRRVVAKLAAGEFFGEMSVVLGETRTARAVAIGRTELLELDGETLEAMCIERPEIAIRMIQRLALRLIGAERRLAALGLDELVGPLVRYLAGRAEDDLEEELRITTSLRELASGSELTLQQTHQALHQLIDQKLIRLVGDELVAPDPNALSTARTRFAEVR